MIDLDLSMPGDAGRNIPATYLEDVVTTSNELLRACSQRMYLEFQWKVPLPQVPAAPMLYRPDILTEVFSTGNNVMNSEVDGMKLGMLDAIPLVHFPVAPRELRRTLDASEQIEPIVLDDKDRELLDTDIDADLLDKRSMPSLTLLKRPLYTEIGLTPAEVRHNERLQRLIPEHLRARSTTEEALRSQFDSSEGLTSQSASSEDLDPLAQQKKQVSMSFRLAKSVDAAFHRLIASIRDGKLGLAGAVSELASTELARQFWVLLFEGTAPAQQRQIWLTMSQYVQSTLSRDGAPATNFVQALQELQLPNPDAWASWGATYVVALGEVDKIASRAALRLEPLDYEEPEEYDRGVFKASIDAPHPLKRTSSRLVDPADQRSRLPAYPVSVCPVLPSGYDEAIRGGDREGATEGSLARRYEGISHLVVQGVRESLPRREQRCQEPHLLVNGSLLIAESASNGSTGCVTSNMTVRARTSANLIFEEYLQTSADTSSLLLEIRPDVCIYDVISERREYRRNAAATKAPTFEQFVVCFDETTDSRVPKRRRVEPAS